MSESVTERRVIPAPPSAILDAIINVDQYPQWQKDVKSVDVLERDEQGRPSRARFVVDARVFTATYELAYAYGDDTVAWHLAERSDQFDKLDGRYTVIQSGDDASAVSYELDVDLKLKIPRFMRKAAAEKIVSSALDNLSRRATSSAG